MKSWLMEHFGFVSVEEYCLRGIILGQLAFKACNLQRRVDALESKAEQQAITIANFKAKRRKRA